MEPADFRELIARQTDEEILRSCLDGGTPYVFESAPDAWPEFCAEIDSGLGVQGGTYRIVGSGRFGFSLKPGANLRRFTDTSDIDLMVVDEVLFDQLWLDLLAAIYPRKPQTEPPLPVGGWLQKRRSEIYTGWITPLEIILDPKIFGDKVKAILDFRLKWFNALKKASQLPPRRHEDIQGRLYRTWRHAELYHLNSLSQLRQSLTDPVT